MTLQEQETLQDLHKYLYTKMADNNTVKTLRELHIIKLQIPLLHALQTPCCETTATLCLHKNVNFT